MEISTPAILSTISLLLLCLRTAICHMNLVRGRPARKIPKRATTDSRLIPQVKNYRLAKANPKYANTRSWSIYCSVPFPSLLILLNFISSPTILNGDGHTHRCVVRLGNFLQTPPKSRATYGRCFEVKLLWMFFFMKVRTVQLYFFLVLQKINIILLKKQLLTAQNTSPVKSFLTCLKFLLYC
jgi:hypothetical protein